MENYLLILELEHRGFVIGTFEDFQAAKIKSEILFTNADSYCIYEVEFFQDYLNSFPSYPINGNAKYVGKCKQCLSKGLMTTYILEIERDLSLQQFISEPQNCSYAALKDEEAKSDVMTYVN